MRKICILILMMLVCIAAPAQKSKRKTTQRKQTTTRVQQTKKKQPTQREQLQADQKRLKKDIENQKRKKQQLDQQVKKQMQDVLALNGEISEKQRTIDTIKTDTLGVYIRGRISTDDYSGNFYKSMVIQQIGADGNAKGVQHIQHTACQNQEPRRGEYF